MDDMKPGIALDRLTLLVKRDYLVDFGTYEEHNSCIALRHKSGSYRYRTAYVYGSGQVVLSGSGPGEKRFYADSDEREFRQFANSIPLAKWYEQKVIAPAWYAWGAGYALLLWGINSGWATLRHLIGF